MANIRIPFLVEKTNKSGVTMRYWQPSAFLAKSGWTSLAFGTDLQAALDGARKRNEEVEAWKHGGARPKNVRVRVAADTFGALIARYRAEGYPVVGKKELVGKGRAVAHTTRKTYETSLKRLEAWAGKHPVAYITRDRVVALCKVIGDPDSDGFIGVDPAHKTLKMLRTLFVYAVRQGMAQSNPADDVALPQPEPRDIIWSPQARDLFPVVADREGDASIALAVLLGFGIGQREADLLKLPLSAFVEIPPHKLQREDAEWLTAASADGRIMGIRLRQNKTKTWSEVPVWGSLRARIETNIASAKEKKVTTILFDDRDGRPWAGESGQTRFQRRFAELRAIAADEGEGGPATAAASAAIAADMPRLQFRDLRRTCVVWLGEHGFDPAAIASITGHDLDETLRILKTYLPRTTGQAGRVIAQLGRIEEARAARDAKAAEA